MDIPPRRDAHRAWCQELAERLATEDGRRTADLLALTGQFPNAQEKPKRVPPAAAGAARPIQIWSPVRMGENLEFERPAPGPFGDHYASRLSIPARKKAGRRRICLFGESVAAGYLLAPHLTPARLLEAQLSEVAGHQSCEVLDFARTNETLDNLVETVEASLQLEPDLLVLFAGNNWNLLETPECSPYHPSGRGRRDYARVLRDGGLLAVAEWSARTLLERASFALERIARLARGRRLPVVVVVPEVNLADWESRQPTAWLPGDGAARWHVLYRQALRALEQQEPELALGHATEMLRLDGWSGPSSCRLMSRARAALGDVKGARKAARAEVDNACYATQALLGSPQAGSMTQTLLRRFACEHGMLLVDLPQVFASYLDGDLPDRRLFLDYCHLSVEGMQLAMAAVSAAILELSDRLDPASGWRGLLRRLPPPGLSDEARATALLGAAVHTAHRMASVTPRAPLLEYWCEQALAASPGVAEAARRLVALRSTDLPEVLTRAQLENQHSSHSLNPQHGWRYAHPDADLQLAIESVLERHGLPGATPDIAPLPAGGLDLAEPRYHWEPLDRFYPDLMPDSAAPRRAIQRFAWPETGFCLSLRKPCPVRLTIIARLPDMPENLFGTLGVAINGVDHNSIKLDQRWRRYELTIPASHVRTGINRLALRWPPPMQDGVKALERAIGRLERGQEADIHPVFGELAALKVLAA